MKRAALSILAVCLLILILWIVALPESLIASLIEDPLRSDLLSLTTEGLRKGLFFNFSAERIVLKGKGGTQGPRDMVIFSDVQGKVTMRSFFTLRPELDFACMIGRGSVTGTAGLIGEQRLQVRGNDILLNDIPFFGSIGISGEGVVSATVTYGGSEGEIRVAVNNAQLRDTSLGGMSLPLSMFHTVKGAVTLKEGRTEIRSLTLDGKGLYARVRGNLRGSMIDGRLEVMTDASFSGEPLIRPLLERYKMSPGYYAIPLRGDIFSGRLPPS